MTDETAGRTGDKAPDDDASSVPSDDVTEDSTDTAPEESAPDEPAPEDDAAAATSVTVPPPPPSPPPPPPPPPPAPPARLVKRREGKVIAGVCTGLAAYTGIDAVAWRIGFVVLTLTGGAGILAYIVLALVMPSAGPGEPLPADRPVASAQAGRWVAIGLIVLGLLVLARNIFELRGGIFWAVLLVGVGLALWGRDLAPRSSPPPAAPPPPASTYAAASTEGSWDASAASTDPYSSDTGTWPPTTPLPPVPPSGPTATAAASAPSQRDPRPRREPSFLGRLVVGAAALAVGIGLVIESAGVDMSAKLYIQILLWIVGAGLIIGAWFGRARWLIFPGALLACALLVFALTPPGFWDGNFGERVWQPTSSRELQSEYSLSAGDAVLDLSQLRFGAREREVEVDLAFGEMLVVVPEDVPVTVDARVQGGELNLFGRVSSGWDNEQTVTSEGSSDIGGLELDAEVGFGELTVRRVLPTDNFEQRLDGDNKNFDFDFRFRDRNDNRGNR